MRLNVELIGLFLVLNLGSVLSQSARASAQRPLPQWLTGIIAVVGFLFLTFVAFLVKRVWCEKTKPRDLEPAGNEDEMENGRQLQRKDSSELKTYVNLAMVSDEDKVTAM